MQGSDTMKLYRMRTTRTGGLPTTRIAIGVAVLAIMAALSVAFTGLAGAQSDNTSCEDFEFRGDAQVYFDTHEISDPSVFDPDGDGIVCEFLFGEVDPNTIARDYASCGHFETQADAQAALDSGQLEHPSFLDSDGDGYACEFRFGEMNAPETGTSEIAQPIALPNTGAGTTAGGDRGNGLLVVTLLLMSGMAVRLQQRLAP